MAVIHIRSVQEAIHQGTLIELANDYRTSGTVKAFFPKQTSYAFAMSTAAFCQHVQQGTPGEKRSRMEALCSFLSKALGLGGKPSQPHIECRLPGKGGQPEDSSLKLEWYAPSRYWVILLHEEQLRPVLKLA